MVVEHVINAILCSQSKQALEKPRGEACKRVLAAAFGVFGYKGCLCKLPDLCFAFRAYNGVEGQVQGGGMDRIDIY